MKAFKRWGGMGLIMAIIFGVTLIVPSSEAIAKTKVVAIEGVGYNVNFSFHDNLESLVGKRVSVTIGAGKTFTGFIKEVGDHLVHLEKLDGKSYFDALIRIEDISAIDTKFRDIKR